MTNSMRNLLAIGGWGNHDALLAPFISQSISSFLLQPLSVEDQEHFTGLDSETQHVCLDLNSGKPLHRPCWPLTDLSLAQALDTFPLLALIPTRLAPHCLPAVSHTRLLIPTRKTALLFAQSEDTQTNAGSAWNQKPVSLQGQCPYTTWP